VLAPWQNASAVHLEAVQHRTQAGGIAANETQRKSSSSPITVIAKAAVDSQVTMQRCFSSAKPLRNLSSQELYIRDLLRQQVVGCICCLPWQSPKAVTALYEMNGRIGLVHVIESDPQGHSPRLRQRPEARILVPGLGGRIPGQLAKEVSAPAAELWPGRSSS